VTGPAAQVMVVSGAWVALSLIMAGVLSGRRTAQIERVFALWMCSAILGAVVFTTATAAAVGV
jgi:hypothetical protein